MFDLSLFKNWDLLSVGIVIAAIGLLGFITILNNPKSISNKLFGYFTIVTVLWSVTNYLSYHARNPEIILFLLRLEIFYAAWLVFFLLALLTIFPKEQAPLPDYLKLFSIVCCLISFINLTPLVFVKITAFTSTGEVSKVANGPGIAIFGIYVLTTVVTALTYLVRKTLISQGLEKKQFRTILIGISLTFLMLLIFNFILPAFLNNPRYISFGGFFIFPLIFSISYAIIRHKLLNLKILSTEILTFVLTIGLLLEVILSKDIGTILFRFSIFLLVLGVGFLLIKSVRREVKQREQLEVLDKELEDANEKLKALDKARAEFITIASHQLRTPPATIKWYLSSILDGDYGKLTPELQEVLQKTKRTNNSLISLIDDMLNVSRIERGKMEFLFEPANLLDLAKITFEQLEPIAQEKGLKLLLAAPETGVPEIMADKEKIRQVMNNLIDNAIKYTKSGTVTASLTSNSRQIIFSVSDTGKGISTDEMESIFLKYSRGKESVKQSAGLGLGLYVAKVIVEQHKGKIWAESKGEGQGSKFIFSLPIKNNLQKTTLVDLTKNQN